MAESFRDTVVRKIQKMLNCTVDRGATPAEAAAYAAKAAEWIERYQIEEAELRAADPGAAPAEVEVCQNFLRTGKRVFNPGMTQVVNGLALGVCCKVILLHKAGEATYGIVGDQLDTDYVCQMAVTLVPQLQLMARLEGVEHGYEKAGLIRWSNQYLTGAGDEIRRRLEAERKKRSDAKRSEHHTATVSGMSTALVCVTGDSLAVAKREAVGTAFRELYPNVRTSRSRSEYDHTAHQRGREAGKGVGLNIAIGGSNLAIGG